MSTTPTESAERAALAELVALEDLRLRIESFRCNTRSGHIELERMRDEYEDRMYGAWTTARAALSPSPASTEDEEADFTGANFDRRTDVGALIKAALAPSPAEVPAEPVKGWKLNHVQFVRGSGKAEIGYLDPEDDRFFPIVTVDTGLYYQPEHAVPLARAILDAITAAASPSVPQAVPQGHAEVMRRMVAGIDHLADLARLWEPDHSSGADRRGWVLAKDARDDAVRLLAAAPSAKEDEGPNVLAERLSREESR